MNNQSEAGAVVDPALDIATTHKFPPQEVADSRVLVAPGQQLPTTGKTKHIHIIPTRQVKKLA